MHRCTKLHGLDPAIGNVLVHWLLVGAGRFELPTPCSRSKCATRLRYAPPDQYERLVQSGLRSNPHLGFTSPDKGEAAL